MNRASGNVPFGTSGDNDFLLDVFGTSDTNLGYQIAMDLQSNSMKFRRKVFVWDKWEKLLTNSDINVQNNTQKIYLTSSKENIEIAEPHNTFYMIKNDFCFVSLSAIRMTSSEAGIAFVGLPNPVGRVNFTLHRAGGTSEPVIWGRTEEGYIYFNSINSTLIGIHAWCSFCYPIAK